MKAAVLFETKGKLSVENVDISEPKKDEVMVKISASGLCHTDWETMRGYQPVNLPAIIGHEGAGIVEAIGEGVDHVEVGDEGGLEDDRDVGGVEELDGVAAVLASVPGALDGQVHPESLEVYHHAEDEDGGDVEMELQNVRRDGASKH